jgi:uncharacterized protein (TIGR03435 family)
VFQLSARRETNEVDVFILTDTGPATKQLTPTASTGGSSGLAGPGRIAGVKQAIKWLASSLEQQLKKPVIDETGMSGDFDIELTWKNSGHPVEQTERITQEVRKQLGLELTPAQRPIEMLVVEKIVR